MNNNKKKNADRLHMSHKFEEEKPFLYQCFLLWDETNETDF